jgi:hypothetical protein
MAKELTADDMKRGAIASPRHKLAAAMPHAIVGTTPPQFLYFPKQLSNWGNDVYGDCVTAEEAFNKACASPEIFITRDLAIAWASLNGYLNGAYLSSVLDTMQNYGFPVSGTNYNDGPYNSIDWTNDAALQNAISNVGTIKLGVAAEQFNTFWSNKNGWFATNLASGNTEDHCVSLCGYGTMAWLAGQLNTSVPNGIDPNSTGYAMFTWGTIGIIDIPSLHNITYEAWVRNPTNTTAAPVNAYIEAQGGEAGKVLSHANNSVWLQNGYQGTGELFFVEQISANTIALACGGGETGQYLSHSGGNVSLVPAFNGPGETWTINNIGSGNISIACAGTETGMFLSHGGGNVWLQTGYQGTGEAWTQVGI